jgi:2-polyprenyl-3-methyl-5-hydroxy-6-metoxy-1,4-benzoquinol methylase
MCNYDYEKNPQGFSSSEGELNVNYQYIYDYIEKYCCNEKKIKILEIGTGGGRNLAALHKKYSEKIEFFGTDISSTAITYASELNIGTFRQASSEVIPFEVKFDLILMIDILEHLESQDKIVHTLTNAQKFLNENGCIYISVPTELNIFSLTWVFSKLYFFKELTRIYFGHLIQFNTKSFMGIIDKNILTVSDLFYSVHFLSQIQMLIFFYCPKILLDLFLGKSKANNFRDSNEILNEGGNGLLSTAKKIFIGVSVPFAKLGFKESSIRKYSGFAAGNLHLLLRCKLHE